MEKLRNILLCHKGKINQITSRGVSELIVYPVDDDTQVVSRSKIKKCIELYDLPVVADNKGYFIATTKEEIDRYNANLQGRIDKIEKRKQKANETFKEINK